MFTLKFHMHKKKTYKFRQIYLHSHEYHKTNNSYIVVHFFYQYIKFQLKITKSKCTLHWVKFLNKYELQLHTNITFEQNYKLKHLNPPTYQYSSSHHQTQILNCIKQYLQPN